MKANFAKNAKRARLVEECESLRERWRTQEPYASLQNKSPMVADYGRRGDPLVTMFAEWFPSVVSGVGREPTGMIDARGLAVERGSFIIWIHKIVLENVDFRYGVFAGGKFNDATITGCSFEDCEFDGWGARQAVVRDTSFRRSELTQWRGWFHSVLERCHFDQCFSNGRFFDFGSGSKWHSCSYQDCHFKRFRGGGKSILFENCRFSGLWEDGVFYGRKRLGGWLFGSGHKPARFVECDFTGLELKNVVFEKGVEFVNCVNAPPIAG